jgi:hypothetical protein
VPYWWGYGYPYFNSDMMGTTPITGITITILPAAITAPAPTMATARGPTPGSPGTIAPTPPAIIRMWHSARAAWQAVPAS